MGRCAFCGKFVFGGVQHGNQRFCSDNCRELGGPLPQGPPVRRVAATAPAEPMQHTRAVRRPEPSPYAAPAEYVGPIPIESGPACPACGGPGPLDVYTTYRVVSLFMFTTWQTGKQLACHRCGTAAVRRGIITSALFGWWGPFGVIITPILIVRSKMELANHPQPVQLPNRLHYDARGGAGGSRAA